MKIYVKSPCEHIEIIKEAEFKGDMETIRVK